MTKRIRSIEEEKRIASRMRHLRELLAEFNVILVGYDPGVTGNIKNEAAGGQGYFDETLSFDRREWGWLEPLLIELREARKKG